MKTVNRRYIVMAAVLFAITFLCVYFWFDPSTSLFPRCPFLSLTGYLCPGCGSQRALHALLHGDVVAAWHFNALMVLFIPLVMILVLAEFCRKKHPLFYMKVNSRYNIWAVVSVILGWWILRNML